MGGLAGYGLLVWELRTLSRKKYVKFQVLKATNIKMTVFGDAASWSLAELDLNFRGRPDYGGSKHL
jgi:hypothetical protein